MNIRPALRFRLSCALAALLYAVAPALADRPHFDGPVTATLLRVIDGDTLLVRAHIWIGQEIEVRVRLRGIDTPEHRGRCSAERRLAQRARAYLRAATASGRVVLTDIGGGKYFGRVLADVHNSDGRDLAAALREAGLARPYRGKARPYWCD